MRTVYRNLALAALAALFLALPAGAQSVDYEKIVQAANDATDFEGMDFSGVFTIVTEKPGKKQSVSQVRMFRRDSKDQFLMLIQLPEADKGQGYLKEGDNLWYYDPTSRRFSHSSMKEALADSEAQNEDFDSDDTLEDYAIAEAAPGMLGRFPVHVVLLKAKHNEVAYDQMRLYIRQDQPLVLKIEYLSLNGRLMRTILYPRYAEVGKGKYFPSQMLIIDEINVGEKSQITLTELSVERLPDKVFTKAFLEQVN